MEIRGKGLVTFLGVGVFMLFIYGNSGGVEDLTKIPYRAEKGEPVDGIRIAWDYSTFQQLSERGGYPRSIRLQDGTVMAVYEDHKTGYALRRSKDDGKTWDTPATIFHNHNVTNDKGATRVNIANSEIIQLVNGDLLAACNYRPRVHEITPFAIAVCRSTDNGITWSEPQIIYEAQPRFTDGCWEPSFLQLPNGNIQIYFANEAPYTHSNEQEISMLASRDNGRTWGDLKTVSFRAGSRDGMPVSKIVGDEIVCVIEDCGFVTFKPYTVRTKLADNWSSPVLSDSPNRSMALGEPVEDWIYMGAPYLGVLPTGETLLTYQVDDTRHDNQFGDRVPYSTTEVAVGDKSARNFTRRTRPFPMSSGEHAIWPSVSIWDTNTVVALASVNCQQKADAPVLIKGRVMRDVVVSTGDVKEYPLFIGHLGRSNLCAGVSRDKSKLHIICKIRDSELDSGLGKNAQRKSGVFLCLDTKNTCLKIPDEGTYKIGCSFDGKVTAWEGKQGKWEVCQLKGWKVSSSIVEGGYNVSFTIPLKKSFNKEEMRIGMALSTKQYVEELVHSDMNKPYTWMKIIL